MKVIAYQQLLIMQKSVILQFGLISQKQNGYRYEFMLDHQDDRNKRKKFIQYNQELYHLYSMIKKMKIYYFNQIYSKYFYEKYSNSIYCQYSNNRYQFIKSLDIKSTQPFFIVYLVKLQQLYQFLTVKFMFDKQFVFQFFSYMIDVKNHYKQNLSDIFEHLKMKFTFKIENVGQKQNKFRELELDANFIKNQFDDQKLLQYVFGYLFTGKYHKDFILKIIEVINRFIFVKDSNIFHKYLTKDQKLFAKIDEERLVVQQSQPKRIEKNKNQTVEVKNYITQMFEQNFNTIYSKDFKNKREDIFDVKDDLNQQKSSVEILAYQNNSSNKCKNYIR